ncbi:hypothetical protein ACWGOK_42945, partial [Streptomyces eurythermus]
MSISMSSTSDVRIVTRPGWVKAVTQSNSSMALPAAVQTGALSRAALGWAMAWGTGSTRTRGKDFFRWAQTPSAGLRSGAWGGSLLDGEPVAVAVVELPQGLGVVDAGVVPHQD